MFERFTDQARKVCALANQEAQNFNHEYIGTEHLLLALIKGGDGQRRGVAVLENLNINLSMIMQKILKNVRVGPDMVTMGKLPQTPRAKKVIECAIEEARNLNLDYVGTEHLLLGLLRDPECIACQVLNDLGLTLEVARAEVKKLFVFKKQDVLDDSADDEELTRKLAGKLEDVIVNIDQLNKLLREFLKRLRD